MNQHKIFKLLTENTSFIFTILLLFVCRSSIADWYHIPSGSMQPTIAIGDRIYVDKLAYQLQIPFTNISLSEFDTPKAGDIVVFESAAADKRLIKRVIGVPGDKIAMQSNRLIINGKMVDYQLTDDSELYVESLSGKDHLIKVVNNRNSRDGFLEIAVPADHYLMLGDNRNNSVDSRYYGFVPKHEIQGRATKVLLSFDADNYYLPRKSRLWMPLI